MHSGGTWIVLLAAITGATAIIRVDIAQRREELHTQARTAHRLLSQATARVDAVLETLVLTAVPGTTESATVEPTRRLPSVYPQVVSAWRRDVAGTWPETAGGAALDAVARRAPSRAAGLRLPVLAIVDAQSAQYTVVLDGVPTSYALRIDARRLVLQDDWPWPEAAPIRATLAWGDQTLVLRDGPPPGLRTLGATDGFEFTKALSSESQPFTFHVQRHTGPAEWPWLSIGMWTTFCLVGYWVLYRWSTERAARQRAAEQVRMARASRLGAMGELAAGIAHELNQPLTAVLAGTQTALRTLRERGIAQHRWLDEERASTIERALELSATQARRASDVVARMRRLVQAGGASGEAAPVDLADTARRLVAMMAEELQRERILVSIEGHAEPALADATSVEQVLHNLLTNAAQALRGARQGNDRRIVVRLSMEAGRVRCTVEDNGPGIAPSNAERLFEPFFTTSSDGLGLGLPLCQTLVTAMGGTISLRTAEPGGAAFEFDLPASSAGQTPS